MWRVKMKNEMNISRRLKGLLCVMLSLVMMFGMSMGVNAEEYDYQFSNISGFMRNQGNGFVDVTSNERIPANKVIFLFVSGGTIAICYNGVERDRLGYAVIAEGSHTVCSFSDSYSYNTYISEDGSYTLNLLYDVPTEETSSNNSSHTHSYTWQTVREATEIQEGEEEYICSCGHVSEIRAISAMGVYWNSMIEKIKNAKSGDTLTFSSETWNSFPKRVMDVIAARRDITIEISFPYQGKMLKVVVPANTAIDNSCDWYGPAKLAEMFGSEEIVK